MRWTNTFFVAAVGALVVAVVVGGACYQPELDGLRCDDDHPCVEGNVCLRGTCVVAGAGACASDVDCPGSVCVLSLCDGDDCQRCEGWTGTCAGPAEGEGEGAGEGEGEVVGEGEGEAGGEGEGEAFDPCNVGADPERDGFVDGDLTIDNPATLSVIAGKRGVNGSLRVVLDAGVDLEALRGLEAINGDLVVDGPLALSVPLLRCVAGSLSLRRVTSVSLPGLVAVPGSVVVEQTALDDLAGLRGLQVVGGDVVIAGNGLATPTGLAGLVSIGGALSFDDGDVAPAARSFSGLSALTTLGRLTLGPQSPAGVDGLSALTTITGALTVRDAAIDALSLPSLSRVGALVVDGAPALTSFAGLAALVTVDNELVVSGAPLLESYAGLQSLSSVGSLQLTAGGPPSLAGLEPLRTVQVELRIDGTALTDVDVFADLEQIGRLTVVDNPRLQDLDGLSTRPRVETLVVERNLVLQRIVVAGVVDGLVVSGCPQLTILVVELLRDDCNSVVLTDLPRLVDGDGLDGVQRVRGDVTIARTGLRSLPGFASLLQVTGTITLVDNPALDVDAPLLADVGGGLVIERAPAATLSGLDGLRRVGGDLRVVDVGARDLAGLADLEVVGGGLAIEDNASLESVFALDELGVNRGVSIKNNPQLATCEAERLAITLGQDASDVVANDGPGCFCG